MNTTREAYSAIPYRNRCCGLVPHTSVQKEGILFAAEVPEQERASLILYEKESGKPVCEIPFPEKPWAGNVFAMVVPGLSPKDTEYNYRIGEKIVTDPYAQMVSGRESFGQSSAQPVRAGFLPDPYEWKESGVPLRIPYRDSVFYELNVRGFTKAKRSGVRSKGTFTGLAEKIPYLKDLGITAVVLMPCYEFDENAALRRTVVGLPKEGVPCMPEEDMQPQPYGLPPEENSRGSGQGEAEYPDQMGIRARKAEETAGRANLWGFGPGYLLAPKRSFCSSAHPYEEFCSMVEAFHGAGIEVIMEMDFSWGADLPLMLTALLWWRKIYHVDGFMLFGNPDDLDALCRNSALSDCKLISDYFPSGRMYPKGRSGSFRNLAECNHGFRDDARRLLKGDEGSLRAFVDRSRYNPKDTAVVNAVTGHDGFTLMDLVSYNERHNEGNTEDEAEGVQPQHSWNCGAEGPTRKKDVRSLRLRQIRNAFSMMMLSQGTPMILAGDEIGNSQKGNSNAWCFDSELSWVDWSGGAYAGKILAFVKKLIAFRKSHPLLHQEVMPAASGAGDFYPPFSCHGANAWFPSFGSRDRAVGIMLCGRTDAERASFLYTAYNFHWEKRPLALPVLPDGRKWRVVLSTGEEDAAAGKSVEVPGRTVLVLEG